MRTTKIPVRPSPVRDAQDRLETDVASDALSFRLSHNLIILEATINGISVPMILDTGAAATIVSRKTAQKLGVKKAQESCVGMGAGGDVEMTAVEIESLSVGSVTHRGLTSLTMDMSEICGKLDDEVDGIIGFDFLSKSRLTIDYPTQRLLLEEAADSEIGQLLP